MTCFYVTEGNDAGGGCRCLRHLKARVFAQPAVCSVYSPCILLANVNLNAQEATILSKYGSGASHLQLPIIVRERCCLTDCLIVLFARSIYFCNLCGLWKASAALGAFDMI